MHLRRSRGGGVELRGAKDAGIKFERTMYAIAAYPGCFVSAHTSICDSDGLLTHVVRPARISVYTVV